ncbi:MAG: 16S rRNA (guanine(966)-N(2))-methyltransferase RsmD [Desulfofustis sp.]|nr:16S rRNA (guanine(966)-N(2))-methyltransferase RsmD [Desulfofustis sp.]
MRIISGTAKGRRLFTPTDGTKTIRPTADRAREAVFNIIGPTISGSHVLDLFAGTGAFGCEALSRGAASVLFVDNSKKALTLVARNISLIPNGPQRATVRQANLSKSLGIVTNGSAGETRRYDLIFADPPYGTDLANTVLHLIDHSTVLSQEAVIIIEENKLFSPPHNLEHLTQIDSRRYGDSLFSFFRSTRET